MGIRHLKIFKTVCEEDSVTKAAQKLYMTQPAVSHAIKELETEKGFPLFDRISGRLHLTGGGKAMLEKTIALLGLYGEIESISPGSRHDSLIRIGSCITAACYWLPAILQGFRSAPTHKNIRIAAQVAAADGVIGMLKANSIDIALLEGPYLLEKYTVRPFSSYRIIAVCHPHHPFAGRKAVDTDMLLGEPLLLREKGSAIRDPFDSWLMLRKRTANPAVSSVNSQALIQMAKHNLGIAVLADRVVERELLSGDLCEVDIPEMDITNEISIAYHDNKYIPAHLEKFIGFIQNTCRGI